MRQLEILFVTPNASKLYQGLADKYSAIEPPTWALLLAGSCRAKGYSVAILDCEVLRLSPEKAVREIKQHNPKLVAFVTFSQNPNGGTTNMSATLAVAEELRRQYPKFKTISIGTYSSALPNAVLDYDCFDLVSINEAVYTLHDLMQTDFEHDLEKVRGLGYKKDGKQFLNPGEVVPTERMDIDLPEYALDLIPSLSKYRAHFWHANYDHSQTQPFFSLYTSLGCVKKCLTGDTFIDTYYGPVTIKELAENPQEPNLCVRTRNPITKEFIYNADAIDVKKYGHETVNRVYIKNGHPNPYLDCTLDHEIMVFKDGKDVPTQSQYLKPGDMVWSYRRNLDSPQILAEIERVELLPDKQDVYCLTVPDIGWFYANRILVKNCNFCVINLINRTNPALGISSADSHHMRFWSPEWVLKQIDILQNKHGVRTLRFADELFFAFQKHYEPILHGIIDRKYDLNFWTYSRLDTVKKRFLDLFKKAGCNYLALGIEAANQTVRKEIDKGGFKDVDIREVRQEIKDAGINAGLNYMFGFPSETEENLQQTLDLAMELQGEFTNFYGTVNLHGTPLYYQAIEKGWEIPQKFEEYGFFAYEHIPCRTEHLTSAEVLRFRDEAWQKYFTDTSYLNMVESKFGLVARNNIVEQTKIKLKRKLLGD